MNWLQVEEYLRRDNRVAVPLGSVEQHAYLSLATDAILSESVAVEAAEPLGVPVYPALAYGITPYFRDFPGSVSLRLSTYIAVVRDVLDSLSHHGFRRILLVNGHGGNAPAGSLAGEWMADHPGTRVRLHNWWNAPETIARVASIDRTYAHASWMENFPWTRLADTQMPQDTKQMVDTVRMGSMSPGEIREHLGDGNYGGRYQRADEEMLAIWRVGVEETRRALEGPWG